MSGAFLYKKVIVLLTGELYELMVVVRSKIYRKKKMIY